MSKPRRTRDYRLASIPSIDCLRIYRRTTSASERHKQSSITDPYNLLAAAAAVATRILPAPGLPGLLHEVHKKRVSRILKTNEVRVVKPKGEWTRGTHVFQTSRTLARHALPSIIGPTYFEAHAGRTLGQLLDSRRIIAWIQRELQNPTSLLNQRLKQSHFSELAELKRGSRWWLDVIGVRKNAESS